jgi:cation diffusion facilitator family transporter
MPEPTRCQRCARVAPWFSFSGNLTLAIHKLAVGLLGGSAALVADAMHSFGDVVGSTSILLATRVSARRPDPRFPYGRGKAEFIGAVFVYIVLLFFAGGIVLTSIKSIVSGHLAAPHYITAVGALVSVLYNYMMYKFATCAGRRANSPAVMADAFENRADALASVAVIVGIFAALLIHPVCDALAALVVGLIIFWNCQEQLRHAARGLMDNGLPARQVDAIRDAAMAQDGVVDVHFVRTRQTGVKYWIDLGISVARDVCVEKADGVAARVRQVVLEAPHCHYVEVYVLPERGFPLVAGDSTAAHSVALSSEVNHG